MLTPTPTPAFAEHGDRRAREWGGVSHGMRRTGGLTGHSHAGHRTMNSTQPRRSVTFFLGGWIRIAVVRGSERQLRAPSAYPGGNSPPLSRDQHEFRRRHAVISDANHRHRDADGDEVARPGPAANHADGDAAAAVDAAGGRRRPSPGPARSPRRRRPGRASSQSRRGPAGHELDMLTRRGPGGVAPLLVLDQRRTEPPQRTAG